MVIPEYDIIVTVVSFSILVLLVITFIIAIFIQYQKRRQQHLLEVKDLKHEFSQILLSSQIEIQEQTLRNISQELHDNISQKLGLAKMQLNHLDVTQPNVNTANVKAVISAAIADIRMLSKSMHPDRIAAIPLEESIANEISMHDNVSEIEITFSKDGLSDRLNADQRIIIFRIFQELLNNALKYAHSTRINIFLYAGESLRLTIDDNGKGLSENYEMGIGHTSIANRVQLLKGVFTLESQPGKGTRASVDIPLMQ